ncbi:MAG TPA: TetR/AcrR family transcriptional regulator [Micromonosporaceae bacterium]|nr:TetR/AcrR family transcriptional regulator [Micromonosporaceae bacterium]
MERQLLSVVNLGVVDALRNQRLTAKGRATRDRIVASAAGLMFERGVAGTSTDDVRASAGVSASQIYHYFDDKKALVRAVIAYQTEAVLGFQVPMLSRLDSVEALQAWRDQIVEMQRQMGCQGGCPIGSLASELADLDADARTDLADAFGLWETAIRDGLRAMRARGDLRSDVDPDRLALAILAALQGGLLLTKTRRDTGPLEAALDIMLDHVRNAIRPGLRDSAAPGRAT